MRIGFLEHEWRLVDVGHTRKRCAMCGATWTSYWYGRGAFLAHCPGRPAEREIKVELGGRGE